MRSLLISTCLFLMLNSCNSKKAELVSGITQLQLTADTVQVELSEINEEKAVSWSNDYMELKSQLIEFAAKDTVPQEISAALDNYLTAVSAIVFLSEEAEKCKTANDSLKRRLQALKTDIENQRGDRSLYEGFFKKEQLESKSIRKHAEILRENYLTAEKAQAQFLPVIERFIRKFVIQ